MEQKSIISRTVILISRAVYLEPLRMSSLSSGTHVHLRVALEPTEDEGWDHAQTNF